MSSLPGRSDSQRSYTLGVDEISVRKIRDEDKDVERRKSGVGSVRSEGSSSSSAGGEATLNDSCALKQFSRFTSKKQLRFLMWVAYTRKFAGDAITNEERRICPLTWCRTEFEDEASMLKHVPHCPELSKGLYFCFQCQKTERLGRFHKGCSGLPSKTDRLANVAKKIFSKLGAGTHKRTQEKSSADTSFSVTDCWKSTDEKKANLYDNLPQWDYPTGFQELPADTSICSEMAADLSAACQELDGTSIIEMMGTDLSKGLDSEVNYLDNFYAETFDEYNAVPSLPKTRSPSPKLSLDTSMSPLHTGKWNYPIQTSHQVSPSRSPYILSMDDIVSPMSPIGTFNPTMVLDVSPTDTEASGASFFSDSGYTSATSPGGSNGNFSRVPSFNDPRGIKRSWECSTIPEAHNMLDFVAPILFPMSLPNFGQAFTESLNSTPSVSRSTSNASDKTKARDLSPHWEDAPSLVKSFSEVLDEHITHTKTTLRDLPSNAITAELLAMSKSSLVSIGLEVLAGILEGRRPSAVVQIFCLTHIACACAIVMNHDDAIHKPEWFQDSMMWVSYISSDRQKQMYTDVATSIWRPEGLLEIATLPRLSSSEASSNKLLSSCQHFLDILEQFYNQAQEALIFHSPVSDFDFSQVSFEISANQKVIEKLISINTIVAFISDITTVGNKLRSGRIKTVRELELELICAGKMSSQSETAYSRFRSHVTRLCDDLYSDQIHISKSRTSHHINSIVHLKNYLHEDIDNDETNCHAEISLLDFAQDDEDLCFDFAGASGEHESHFTASHSFEQNHNIATPFTLMQPSHVQPQPQTQTPYHAFLPPQPQLHPTNTPLPPISSTPSPLPQTQTQPPPPTTQPSPHSSTTKYHCPLPHCTYVPSGEEKWKASNLRRHKRTQHPDLTTGGSKAYPCRWPGCKSVFTRSDNLRSHQRGRGHDGVDLNVCEGKRRRVD